MCQCKRPATESYSLCDLTQHTANIDSNSATGREVKFRHYWTADEDEPCQMQAQVGKDGLITMVDYIEGPTATLAGTATQSTLCVQPLASTFMKTRNGEVIAGCASLTAAVLTVYGVEGQCSRTQSQENCPRHFCPCTTQGGRTGGQCRRQPAIHVRGTWACRQSMYALCILLMSSLCSVERMGFFFGCAT